MILNHITDIVVHCAACPQDTKVEAIQRYWRENLKWRRPGYHRLIRPDGSIAVLQGYNIPTNGVAGHNATSIHISYIGGVDKNNKPIDNRTPQQLAAMILLITELKALCPNATIRGHRDFPGVAKACPSFDVATWLKTVGISAKPSKK